MSESSTMTVDIPDFSYSLFIEFLSYIYTDQVNLTPDNVPELLSVSNKYNIPRLKRMCELYLLQSEIDKDTVLNLLKLADLYDVKELKNTCFDYVVEKFGEMMVLPEYVAMARSHPSLVLRIQKKAAKVHFSSSKLSPHK